MLTVPVRELSDTSCMVAELQLQGFLEMLAQYFYSMKLEHFSLPLR